MLDFSKKIFLFMLMSTPLYSLGFGSMGTISSSMGGAGVALKTPFSLYYNPALLSSESNISFGYAIGAGYIDNNVLNILSVDFNNIANSLANLAKDFSGISTTAVTSSLALSALPVSSAMSGASSSSSSSASAVPSSLIDVLKNTFKGVISDTNGTMDLKMLAEKVKNSGRSNEEIGNIFRTQLKMSSLSESQKTLFDSISRNIDFSNLSASTSGIDSISIQRGGNKALDKAISDTATLQKSIFSGRVDLSAHSGLSLQMSSGAIKGLIGSIGVGYFMTVQGSFVTRADQSKSRLIVGSSEGSGGYFELSTTSDSFRFSKSDKTSFDNYSVLSGVNSIKLVAAGFTLAEVPIGYAQTIYLPDSNLNIGFALKYLNAFGIYEEKSFSSISSGLGNISAGVSNFGLDFGLYYELDLPQFSGFGVGFVAKNVNSPRFSFGSTIPDARVLPQLRLGLGYNGDIYSFALDVDLSKNSVSPFVNFPPRYTQIVGGGGRIDLGVLDLRAGASYDFRRNDGLVLSTGVSLFKIIDFSLEVGTGRFIDIAGILAPNHLSLTIGGNFVF